MRPRGISNDGNTCYLNAVLQALLHCHPFTNRLLHQDLQGLMQCSQEQKEDQCLVRALTSFLQDSSVSDQARSAAGVRAVLAAADARWGSSRQQDAHELLLALIDKLQRDITAAQVDADPRPRRALRVSAALCPAVGAFSGCLEHTITCISCSLVTKVKEPITHLSLQLGSSSTGACRRYKLQRLLATYFEEEHVDKKCDHCKEDVAHSISHSFRRVPQVLVIHLKRFSHQALSAGRHRFNKLTGYIDLHGGELDVGPYCLAGSTRSVDQEPLHKPAGIKPQPLSQWSQHAAQQQQQQQQQQDSSGSSWGSGASDAAEYPKAHDAVQPLLLPSACASAAEEGPSVVLMSLPDASQSFSLLGEWRRASDSQAWNQASTARASAPVAREDGGSPMSGIGGIFEARSCSSDESPEVCKRSTLPAARRQDVDASIRPAGTLPVAATGSHARASVISGSTKPAAAAKASARPEGQIALGGRPPRQPCKQFSRKPGSVPISAKKPKLGLASSGLRFEAGDQAGLSDDDWDAPAGLKGGNRDSPGTEGRPSTDTAPFTSQSDWWPFAADGEDLSGSGAVQPTASGSPYRSSPDAEAEAVGNESGCAQLAFDQGAAAGDAAGEHTEAAVFCKPRKKGQAASPAVRRTVMQQQDSPKQMLPEVQLLEDSDWDEPEAMGSLKQGAGASSGAGDTDATRPLQDQASKRRLAPAMPYHLHGIINHRGNSSASGHYTAACMVDNAQDGTEAASHPSSGRWCLFDDERVNIASLEDVLQDAACDGYVLFFTAPQLV